MRFSGCKYIQAPLLEVSEAKDILKDYKTNLRKRTEEDHSEDIINMEFEMLGEGINE